MYPEDENIIAIAHDHGTPLADTGLPQMDINNISAIADFVIEFKNKAN